MLKRIIVATPALVFWGFIAASPARAQDPELTNYRSGISLNFGDSATTYADKGTGYAEEYLYFDKVIDDHKVVYIRSTTTISASHNARNVSGSTTVDSDTYVVVGAGGGGTIRYRVDGDQHWGKNITSWPVWSAASFSTLTYGLYGDSGVSVVGSTGRVGTLALANKETSYYRGMVDAAGNEIHILTLADDDNATAGSAEFGSSDGKIWLFVVNPVTPCATWRVTGNGQFYTTPLKKWFFPNIYAQTTYIAPRTGTVTVELRDIMGGNISYRINGGSTVNVGATNVTLDDADFSSGSNTLEYWVTSTPAVVATRTVVKNPAHPSLAEDHGDRLWIDAAHWTSEARPRILGNTSVKWWIDQWKATAHTTIETTARTGVRTGYKSAVWSASSAMRNALVARIEGMSYTKSGESRSFAEYAKMELFETPALLDPVGGELNSSGSDIPAREIIYRGYYDVVPIFEDAGAYDIIAGHYRDDQVGGAGLTAVENYFIRDALARWVHFASTDAAGYADPIWDDPDTGGMWDTARKSGATMIAGMMPSYSTDYYGTCGLDGSTTATTWAPFATVAATWKDIFFDDDVSLTGFPDAHKNMGWDDYNFRTSDGQWLEKIGYSGSFQMGRSLMVHRSMLKLFTPQNDLPATDMGMALGAAGQLLGIKDGSGPSFRAWAGMQNAWFPAFRDVAQPAMLALASSNAESLGKQLNTSLPWPQIWYNHALPEGSAPTGTVETPVFTPPGSSYSSAQNVVITCGTAGSSIYYTTDGSTPDAADTLYASPVAISATTQLKAIGIKSGMTDSTIRDETYTITVAGGQVDQPVILPVSGSYFSTQSVSITCGTAGASIYYTTDGSDPDAADTLYSATFTASAPVTVKAIGIKASMTDSTIAASALSVDYLRTTADNWTWLNIPNQTDDFTLTLTLTPEQSANNTYIAFADAPPEVVAHGDMTQFLRCNNTTTGFFDARNGTAYAAANSLGYTGATGYTVVLTLHTSAGVFSSYSTTVNGTTIADHYAFRSPVTNIDRLAVWTQVAATNTLRAEDFALGEPAPPESPRPKYPPRAQRRILLR